MKVIQTAVYEGPNIYAPVPVIRWRIDLEGLEECPTGRLGAAFTDALLDHLPGLGGHGGSEGASGGFARAMAAKDGVSLGQVLAHTVLELQRLVGAEVEFAEARPVGGGVYDVLYGYEGREVGFAAWRLALALIHHLLPSELRPAVSISPNYDFARDQKGFIRFARAQALDQTTLALVNAAEARGIPWFRLFPWRRFVQFGYGRFQKRIHESVTSGTGYIGVHFSREKALTTRILLDLCFPVPRQRPVRSARDAVRAAEDIGYPVVVKPNLGGKGAAIGIRLTDAEAVSAAFERARGFERTRGRDPLIVVERFIEGDDHRMLVVDGKLIAVAKRLPAHVVGDGVHTVEELMEEVNRDPRRGTGFAKLLVRLQLDAETKRMLAGVGYTGKTVPEKGETVLLRRTANISTGGTAVDMSDRVHPENREMAIRAAQAIGLDVAGVDFLSPDIRRSYKEVGGGICEVNQSPGLRVHWVAEGESPDVVGPILDMLYPPGTPSRIPIAAVTGGAGATAAASMLAHVLQTAGHTVGLATGDGITIDGDALLTGDRSGPAGARSVLHNPSVDAAVLETSPEGVLHRGLGFDHCDVAAVLDMTAGSSNEDATVPAETLAEAMGVVVRAARGAVVLDADDELCLAMADQADAETVCYVTVDAGHPRLDEHLAAGGRAVVLEKGEGGETIVLRDGDERTAVVETDRIPALRDKRYDTRSAMFAAAMAHALGKTADEIGEGLNAFEPAGATTSAVDDAGDAAPGDDIEQPNKSPVRDAG
jgi:cyanophycin synthetase